MASNDDFELTEKYKNNVWAIEIRNNRIKDRLKVKTERNAASHSSVIHLQESSGTHESNCERTDHTSYEYSSTRLNIDDIHLFGRNPLTDDVILFICWDCGKATKVQNLLSHIKDHHISVEEYERKIDISKKCASYVTCERQYTARYKAPVNSAKKRKKVKQTVVSDGFSEEKSDDIVPQSDSFLSQNSLIARVPIESENSIIHSNTHSFTKRRKGTLSKSKKGKTKVSYQSQENVQNLSNSVYSEQSTSSVDRTEDVLFSNHASPDSNHSVSSGHSATLADSTLYSSNHVKSIKQSSALDTQSKERVHENSSDINYFHQSLSVLNVPTESAEQQPCINNLEPNEVMRTSTTNQNFTQRREKSLFSSNNEQECTGLFLSPEIKQPVKSPPRSCPETSISNNSDQDLCCQSSFFIQCD